MPPIALLVVWGLFAVVSVILRAALFQNDRYRQRLLRLNMNTYRKSQYLSKLPAWYYHGSAVLRVLVVVWAITIWGWLVVAYRAWALLALYGVVGVALLYAKRRLGVRALRARATNPVTVLFMYLSLLLFWPTLLLYIVYGARVVRDHRRAFLNSFGHRNYKRLSRPDQSATLYSRSELDRLFSLLATHLTARPIVLFHPLLLLGVSCLLWLTANLREFTSADGIPLAARLFLYVLLVAHLAYLAAIAVSPLAANPVIALLRRTPRRVSLYQFNSLAALLVSYLLTLTVFFVWETGAGGVNAFNINRVITTGVPLENGRPIDIEVGVWGLIFAVLFVLALGHMLLDAVRFRRTDADLRRGANDFLLRRQYHQARRWAERVDGTSDDPDRLRQTLLGASLGVNDWEQAYALMADEDSEFAEALVLANCIAYTPLTPAVRTDWLREMLLRATNDEVLIVVTTIFLHTGAVAPRLLLNQLRAQEITAPVTLAVLNYTAGEVKTAINQLHRHPQTDDETVLNLVARLVDVWLSLETSEDGGASLSRALKAVCEALDRYTARLDPSQAVEVHVLRHYLDRTASLFAAHLGVTAYHQHMAWLDEFVLHFDRKTDRILRRRRFTPFDNPFPLATVAR